MKRYTIRLNYTATYTTVVEGEFKNEGEAFEVARTQAEEADISDFVIGDEKEVQILSAT